jgi:DNA-binding Xre family transcriptional regulator
MPTAKPKKNKNPHDGTTLDDFLREEGILEEIESAALKRVLALKVADLMRKKQIKKATMARQMRTSRAALDRLLDPSYPSVTLSTLTRAAKALGKKIKIDLIPA